MLGQSISLEIKPYSAAFSCADTIIKIPVALGTNSLRFSLPLLGAKYAVYWEIKEHLRQNETTPSHGVFIIEATWAPSRHQLLSHSSLNTVISLHAQSRKTHTHTHTLLSTVTPLQPLHVHPSHTVFPLHRSSGPLSSHRLPLSFLQQKKMSLFTPRWCRLYSKLDIYDAFPSVQFPCRSFIVFPTDPNQGGSSSQTSKGQLAELRLERSSSR